MNDALYTVDESSQVICPELYNRLRSLLPGGVLVANQGEAWQATHGVVGGRLRTQVYSGGEYYRVCCPFCGDTRHRLWVNHMYGQPDVSGWPMRFLAHCYNESCLSKAGNSKALYEKVMGFVNAPDRRRQPFALNSPAWSDADELATVEAPGQVVPMVELARSSPDHPAVTYLRQRRYTLAMMEKYELGYCLQSVRYPAARNRVIIPIRMHGQLVGWQARRVGPANGVDSPKYYGMPGMRKKLMLYNYDTAATKPYVVVVEGATDCHVVGDHSVAMLGKTLSFQQRSLLLSTWGDRPILLLLDPDAREQARGVVAELRQSNAIVVEICLADGYDPGDYDPQTVHTIIRAQAQSAGVRLP